MRSAVLDNDHSPWPGAVAAASPPEHFPGFTCSHCLSEQDGVGHKDEQHWQVCGDVVGDGVLQTPLTPEGGKPGHSPKKPGLCLRYADLSASRDKRTRSKETHRSTSDSARRKPDSYLTSADKQ